MCSILFSELKAIICVEVAELTGWPL